jgi:hypothetical protein
VAVDVAALAATLQAFGSLPLAAAIATYILTRLWEARKARVERERQREQFLRALYFEIHFNTQGMERFAEKNPNMTTISDALRIDETLIPHIIDARHTEIYTSNITSIHHLDKDIIGEVVTLNGDLAKLKA